MTPHVEGHTKTQQKDNVLLIFLRWLNPKWRLKTCLERDEFG